MTPPAERRLRAAIVGAGLMGRRHADAISRAGGKVVAVVDPVLDRARTLAGEGLAIASIGELAGAEIDVVHVCAPLAVHATLAHEAIDLGAHVIVEKPLASDGRSTAAVVAAAAARGLLVVPVHQFLFQPGVQRVLRQRDRFGRIVRCVFEAATAGAEHTDLTPDELVADILPHPLALFRSLIQADLSGVEWLVVSPGPGELRAVADLQGTTLEIAISTHARPTRATLDVAGTRASAHADLFHGFSTVERGTGTGMRKLVRPFGVAGTTLGRASLNIGRRALEREVAYPGLRELVRRSYVAIARGSPPPISEQETVAVALARDAILEAMSTPDVREPGR